MMEHGRRAHDVGGLTDGEISLAEHDYAPWEKKVDAIMRLLAMPERGVITVDELRRAIEDMGERGQSLAYYQRWIEAITQLLLEKGLVTPTELGARMQEVHDRHEAARHDV